MVPPPTPTAKHVTLPIPYLQDPMTISTNDNLNTPPPLTEDQKDTLRLMQGMDPLLQMYFQKITHWQSALT